MTPSDRSGSVTIEPAPGRWRARFNDAVLADSDAALMVRDGGGPAQVYFPAKHVEQGYLSPSQTTSTSALGEAKYWTVEYNGEIAEDAVWSYPQPSGQGSGLAGLLAFDDAKGFEVYPLDPADQGHSLTDEQRGY